MQSIIADHARTKAEYALLAAIVAPVVGAMDEADIINMCRLTLEEYRQLPDSAPAEVATPESMRELQEARQEIARQQERLRAEDRRLFPEDYTEAS